MKKVLIAVGCLLLGMALAVVIMPLAGVDLGWLTGKFETQIYDLTEPFEALEVDAANCDVFLYRERSYPGGVYIQEGRGIACRVEIVDGVLTISWAQSWPWLDKLFFWRDDEQTLSVYLPERVYERLSVRTTSGDIYISDGLSPSQVDIRTDSGYVSVWNMRGGELCVETGSGSVSLSDSELTAAAFTAGSGEVWLSQVELGALTAETGSGDIGLDWVESEGEMTLRAGSGDIDLWDSDAAALSIETGSGDIRAFLLSPKRFEAHSDSGDVTAPASDESAGLCKAVSGSGDIYFQIEN